ncbi:hypothetical protein [Haloarcula sp. JP-L23]|uniref:hypothetical protein n=1 Tax=Haloarcula sp. JP-L23 TaxID=2716717 RepID=UPI00140F3C5E|nr:hypothetical protein G9465_18445 [Haloarcula sp. JP-L23]
MHMLIHGLVPSETPDAAVETAKYDVFQPLARDDVFDYHVTFDADGRGVAGKDRWGDHPVAEQVDSDHGQELVEQGWQATVDAYTRSFDQVEEFLTDYEQQVEQDELDEYSQSALDDYMDYRCSLRDIC